MSLPSLLVPPRREDLVVGVTERIMGLIVLGDNEVPPPPAPVSMAVGAEEAARFGLEARVACNCGTWEPGTVVGHDYTDERLDGQVCPYQVRLDDGRLFCVPADDVSAPRLWPATCS